jgi:hypothetical protein
MDWIVQRKIEGKWEDVVCLPTRRRARTAVQGNKYLFPNGDEYRVRKVAELEPPKVAYKVAAAIQDLWGYLPFGFREVIRGHGKGCAPDCGVKWLGEQLIQAGVNISN